MIKKFKVVIDFSADVQEKITPALINQALDYMANKIGRVSQPSQENLDMLQDIISFIINHPQSLAECVYAYFPFNPNTFDSDKDINEHISDKTDLFIKNIVKAAAALGPKYVSFVTQLDFKNVGKTAISEEERLILLQLCLMCFLNMTILSSRIEAVPEQVMHIQ